jgi:ABC-type multidrug transport system fused ATPase/permease subunit
MANKENNKDNELPKKKFSAQSWEEVRWLMHYLKPYKIRMYVGFFILLCATIPSLLFPMSTGFLADIAMGKTTNMFFNSIERISLFLLGLTVFQAVFSYFRIYTFSYITENVIADITQKLYNQIMCLPLAFFESTRVGDLMSRITADTQQLHQTLRLSIAELLRGLVTLLGGLVIICLIIPWKLTILMLSIIPLFVILAMFFGKKIKAIAKQTQDQLALANTAANETLHAIQAVKVYTNEGYETERYGAMIRTTIQLALKSTKYNAAFVSFIIAGFFGCLVVILTFGFKLISSGQMTIGELISFMMYSIFIGGSVAGMGEIYSQLQRTLGATERLRQLFNETPEVNLAFALSKQNIPALSGTILFENVRFHYPSRTDVEVLKGINMNIKKGSVIALAGESGAGKSTIAQLILQFYRTYSGSIMIDGKEASSYDLTQLRNSMAIVPQDIVLFGGTLRENIAYSTPDASDDLVIDAAKKAYAWEFIERFPDGLDTVVGERGIKLSGGQRQRIAIARAFLKNPSILILDEATSSLDSKSESMVQVALQGLMANRTTIVIAHRLSTIQNVDCIYVINDGIIEEEGTYEALLNSGGTFSRLIQLQQENNKTN